MTDKKRLDVLVHERGLAPSREMAKRYIMAGEIRVEGELQFKPAVKVAADATITLKTPAQYVSRGGLKLETALKSFPVTVSGRVCADVGASTGGFTDCLLKNGAVKVYAIDVGYGQLADKLRQDERVVVMERTNVRYLEKLPEPVSLVVMDVSFISIRLLLPVIREWLAEPAEVISLVKPQFEAGKSDVGKGGVIKDPAIHRQVLVEVLNDVQSMGYAVKGLVQSAITGSKGNIEFLAWLKLEEQGGPVEKVAAMIDQVLPVPDEGED